jgi:hypothetical protein
MGVRIVVRPSRHYVNRKRGYDEHPDPPASISTRVIPPPIVVNPNPRLHRRPLSGEGATDGEIQLECTKTTVADGASVSSPGRPLADSGGQSTLPTADVPIVIW